MNIKNALLAATVLAAPLAATAQPIDGVYVSGGFGANYRDKQDIKGLSYGAGPLSGLSLGDPNYTNPTIGQINSDLGFVGLGAVGYGFGNGLRAEIEGNYRQNKVRSTTGTAYPARGGGQVESYGAMVNVLYDIDLAGLGVDLLTPVVPYVGAGAGYGWTKLRGYRNTSTDLLTNNTTSNGQDGNFAYQGIAGVAFPITDVPGLAITAEYRFYGQIEKETVNLATDTPAGRSFGSAKLGNSFNHSGLIGLRYAFDQAPPPPPPAPVEAAPVQAPSRSYLVFFDWDKATLTTRARQIVREAADGASKVAHTTLEVNGYTDTSGTPKYNQGLSVRRAEAVAAELVRDGVSRNEIAIHGYGETRLLVPTAQGVREPQNRRVEIIIR